MKTEQKILQDIQTVGNADHLEDIEKVVTGSVMLELVMQGFPEFRPNQQHFVEDLLSPSITHQIMHKYLGYYLGAGTVAMLLVHLLPKFVKKAGPAAEIAGIALEPFLKGFSRAAMVLILAQTAYQADELYEAYERKEQVNDFFEAGAAGQSFFGYSEMKGANSAYQLNKWFFIGNLAMMIVPSLKGVITRSGAKIAVAEFMEDCKAFEKVGLEPGKWDQLDSAIEARRAQPGISADELADAERAYLRLADKLKAKLDWNLDAIKSGKPTSPIDIKLMKALKTLGPAGGNNHG
jgi:hypothetical protein